MAGAGRNGAGGRGCAGGATAAVLSSPEPPGPDRARSMESVMSSTTAAGTPASEGGAATEADAQQSWKPRYLHTMLRVLDLDKSIDFYTRLLGMKLLRRTDYPGGRFTLAF